MNVAQLVHTIYQFENLTGHSVDDVIDGLLSGNISQEIRQLVLDTFERVKNDPVDVGANAVLYALIYKALKKAIGGSAGRIDLGLFYLKPI